MKVPVPKPAIWGRYETKDVGRLARNRFEDQPGAYHRIRYMPDERYPEFPWTLCVFAREDDANEINAEGEMRA